jgi:HK97 family phage portal protein
MWKLRRKSPIKEEQRSISFQDVWGSGTDATVNASAINTALTLAPVFAATRLIADTIASLPLQGYRKVGDERRSIATPALFANPSIFGGAYEWVQRALVSLLLRGNAYGLVTSVDKFGYPSQVEWLHPDDVTLENDQTVTRPKWFYLGRPVDAWLGRDSVGELLHIPWYVLPGQVLGLSPIRAFSTTIEAGIYVQRFGRDFFSGGAVPAAVLETDQAVNQDQAKLIKERFLQAAKGRAPVVLGAGTTYKPITVPPEESQFLQSIKANATIIASIYGVRPERIGGESGNSMTYANVENQAIADLHDLRPYLTKLEAPFSSLLPKPQYVRFNLDALLRADTKTRYETHGIALDKKFKTVDEIREDEDLPPLTDDQKAEIAASQPKPVAPATGPGPDNVIQLPRAANQ